MIDPALQQIVDRAFDRAERRDQELADLAASTALALALAELLGTWLRLVSRAPLAKLTDGEITRGDPADLDGPIHRFFTTWRATPNLIDRHRVVLVAIEGILENYSIEGENAVFYRNLMLKVVWEATPDFDPVLLECF